MRKLKLFKSLLVVATLLVGGTSFAWAETVGNVDNSSSGAKSTILTLNNGGTVHYEFTATNDEADNGHGWILVANDGSSDLVRLRCDNWELVAAANTGCFSNYDWNTFRADMNGSTVNMDVTLVSNVLTMSSTITKEAKEYSYRYMKYLDTAPASLDICLEVANAYLNITTGTSTDNQFEVKTPVFGSISGNGVAVENFSSATAESDIIKNWVGATITNVTSTIGLGNVTEVAKVDINTIYETGVKPTYVSGNCIELISTYSNNNGNSGNKVVSYGTYDFTPVSSGYLVFNGDSYRSTDGNTNHPHEIVFLDGDGNDVLKLCYANGSKGQTLRAYNSAGTQIYSGCTAYMRGFTAFGISGLVIDMGTGNCIMTVDYSERTDDSDAKATRKIAKVAFNIGTGKNIAKLELGRQNQNGANVTFKTYLDNVSLYQIGTTAVEYDYTINYKVNGVGDNVKTTAGKSTTLGETINAETVFWVGDVKYVLNGSQTTSMNITAGSNVLNINVKECDTYTYNVYAVNSSSVRLQEEPIATATAYEGEDATLTWSMYIKIGDTWYSTAENTFRITKTEAGTRNVVYAPSNMAYFFEMENLTRSGGAYLTEESTSYSNYSRIRLSRGSTYYTPALAGGTYLVTIPWANSNNSAGEVYVYTRTAGGVLSEKLATLEATNGSGTFNATITVPDGYSIAFNGNEGGSANNNARMDYMTLRLLIPATLGAKGYTTFASQYALDCANLPEGLKAYYVEAENISKTNNKVTLTPITGAVAAGTGMLLQGTASTSYDIPVAASGTDLSTTNKMVGCTTETVLTSTTTNVNNFYVLVNGETAAEFQNLANYVASHNVTIPAGKAYLDATGVSSARLTISFGDEATGIKTVQGEGVTVNGYYDLQGRRVAQPAKGLYIVNGKKMVIK